MTAPPVVSVVLATYNRAAAIAPCVERLLNQTLAAPYEVIVVDNNSTDDTPAAVAALTARDPRVRYLHEPRQGVSVARNAGLRAARAPLCAITDDDVHVPANWLERLVARIEGLGPRVAVVGGEIAPLWGAPVPDWLRGYRILTYLSAQVSREPVARELSPGDWLIECNVIYRRAQLLRHGGMPEQLDRVGASLLSGGQAINLVLFSKGWTVFYDPEIVVQHQIPAARMTQAWLRRRAFWQGVTEHHERRYLMSKGVKSAPYRLRPPEPEHWLELLKPEDVGTDELERGLARLVSVGWFCAALNLL